MTELAETCCSIVVYKTGSDSMSKLTIMFISSKGGRQLRARLLQTRLLFFQHLIHGKFIQKPGVWIHSYIPADFLTHEHPPNTQTCSFSEHDKLRLDSCFRCCFATWEANIRADEATEKFFFLFVKLVDYLYSGKLCIEATVTTTSTQNRSCRLEVLMNSVVTYLLKTRVLPRVLHHPWGPRYTGRFWAIVDKKESWEYVFSSKSAVLSWTLWAVWWPSHQSCNQRLTDVIFWQHQNSYDLSTYKPIKMQLEMTC